MGTKILDSTIVERTEGLARLGRQARKAAASTQALPQPASTLEGPGPADAIAISKVSLSRHFLTSRKIVSRLKANRSARRGSAMKSRPNRMPLVKRLVR